MTLKAEKFEELLTRELTASLDPQRGKALAAFRAHLTAEAERPVIAGSVKPQSGRDISRKEFWFWSSVPSVAAACLAVVVTLKLANGLAAPGGGAVVGAQGTASQMVAGNTHLIISPKIQQTDIFSSRDGGVMVNDQVPQRVVREQREQTTQWLDGNEGATYKLTQPEENLKYERVVPF